MIRFNGEPVVQSVRFSMLLNNLVDFRPYLNQLVAEHQRDAIEKHYVDLSCRRTEVRSGMLVHDSRIFKPTDMLLDQWLEEKDANHLSILGDFGMGKTWFARHYAYRKALEYFERPDTSRVPIFVDLSNLEATNSIEDFIIHLLSHRGVVIKHHNETLSFLNAQGKLLLIFDGFDQMQQSSDTYLTGAQNFWHLHSLIKGNSKIILMCRTHYFKHLAEEAAILRPVPASVRVPLGRDRLLELGNAEGKYRLVHLVPMGGDEIKLALQKRLPDHYASVYDKIQSIYDLGGLAGRPVLLDLIAKIFPRIDDVQFVNQLKLYETYFTDQAVRGYRPGKSLVSPEARLSFVGDLAWHMFITQETKMSASSFSEAVRGFFKLSSDQNVLDQYEREMRVQSYLVRDDEGGISFGHESFKEFLTAQRLAGGIARKQGLMVLLEGHSNLVGRRLYLRGIYKFLPLMLEPKDEPFLLELLCSPYNWERFMAVYLLGRPKDPGLRPVIRRTLLSLVTHEDDIVTRREICYALARLGEESYLSDLVEELDQDVDLMRHVYAIGYFDYHQDRGGPIEEIRWRLVNGVDQPARVEYIHFLGEYGNADCVIAIEPYARDHDERVRLRAKEALDKLLIRRQSA